MKIKKLNDNQKKIFKNELIKYQQFLEQHIERLSTSSKSLYARTLAYISVMNNLELKTPKETCIELTRIILSEENLNSIYGTCTSSDNNKNIQISAFKNLIEVYKLDIKKNVSPNAYKEMIKMIGQKGNIIRKKIQEKRQENELKKFDTLKTWEEFQELLDDYNKKYKYIYQQYLITNEIPDYHFLRDCLICNLYLNNSFKIKSTEFNVILRNEYKNLYLHIGDDAPPSTNKNYFWIKLDSNDHKIIINKNKTTGGLKRVMAGNMGETTTINQKNQKIFPLHKNIAKIILFIKQVFNERPDKPFIKCNNRQLSYNSSTWGKMLSRVFKKLGNNISCNIIRKVYNVFIDWEDLNEKDKILISSMNDFTKNTKKAEPTFEQKKEHLKKMMSHLHKSEALTPQEFSKTIEIEFC